MNVLLIGGGSVLMDAIIDKLNKNGHQAYVLTGQKAGRPTYKHVFEKYNFPYDSDAVKDVFKSVLPEAILFTGAYDTNYAWKDERKESVNYMAGLSNILSAYALLKAGRFLYLSSQDVYGHSYPGDVKEAEIADSGNFRAMALAQGESLCASYRERQNADVTCARLDNLYFIPRRDCLGTDPCSSLCLEGLKTGRISASSRKTFSMLFLSDAVEFIYQLLTGDAPNYGLYHLSSGKPITEMELAGLVRQELDSKAEIQDCTVGEAYRLVLSPERFQKEFRQSIFVNYDEGVKRVVQYMKRHSGLFLGTEDTGMGWGGRMMRNLRKAVRYLLPFIENMACFIPFFMLNNRAVGSRYFDRLDFYLLYVLLFAIVHGQQQAIFSGLLAVAGYLFRQMYTRSGFDVLIDYNTYVWIAQLFILGMTVGYMRDQLHTIKKKDAEEIGYLEGQLADIAEINDSNVRMKHAFETRIVNQQDSLGKIYDITSDLDQYAPEEVLFYAAEVLGKLMDSQDVAIYTVANTDYARLFSSTSKKARQLGNSIKYSGLTEMYDALQEGRPYINRTLDGEMPLLAGGIYGLGHLQVIMMLWGIPWERMTLNEANRLTVAGRLIQNSVLRADQYMEALRSRRYLEGTDILETEAFRLMLQAYFRAKEKGLTECVLLKMDTGQEDFRTVASLLKGKMRQSDYMGIMEDGGLYVLLPDTDEENADIVIRRFWQAGYKSSIWKETSE